VTALLVVLGAALGAPARYLVDRAVRARTSGRLPWGTLAVNVAGSLVLGALLGAAGRGGASPALVAALGTGFCGALTTYSTFGAESVQLAEDGERRLAVVSVAVGVAAGLAAAATGWAVARALI
jgi:CrcB protein